MFRFPWAWMVHETPIPPSSPNLILCEQSGAPDFPGRGSRGISAFPSLPFGALRLFRCDVDRSRRFKLSMRMNTPKTTLRQLRNLAAAWAVAMTDRHRSGGARRTLRRLHRCRRQQRLLPERRVAEEPPDHAGLHVGDAYCPGDSGEPPADGGVHEPARHGADAGAASGRRRPGRDRPGRQPGGVPDAGLRGGGLPAPRLRRPELQRQRARRRRFGGRRGDERERRRELDEPQHGGQSRLRAGEPVGRVRRSRLRRPERGSDGALGRADDPRRASRARPTWPTADASFGCWSTAATAPLRRSDRRPSRPDASAETLGA